MTYPKEKKIEMLHEASDDRPEAKLYAAILYRAFLDAIGGEYEPNHAKLRKDAILFLNDKVVTDLGTASEMCIEAFGSDYFLKKLLFALKNKEQISNKSKARYRMKKDPS